MLTQETPIDYKVLEVSSRAFRQYGAIPYKYTCDGEDINPPLDIKNIPVEAKSLTLIVEDPDAPRGTWLHWLVWNIPVTHRIKEDDVPGDQGVNDFGKVSYGGPCPPSGAHRYYFKVYALNSLLDLPRGLTRTQVEEAMSDHIIAYGETVGIYKKKSK